MKPQNFQYFKIKLQRTEHLLDFFSIEDFRRFAMLHHIKSIYQLTDEQDIVAYFALSHNAALLRQQSMGFQTIEDYLSAEKAGYPDAVSFYEGSGEGYDRYEDYKLVKEAGIADKKIFETIKQQGYVEGFNEYLKIKDRLENQPDQAINNPNELFQYANRLGFKDFSEFKEAMLAGFDEAGIYRVATDKGFTKASEYHDSLSRGFTDYKSYAFAVEKGIRDTKEAIKFFDLELYSAKDCLHDQKVLLSIISKLEQGKKFSINKIQDLFQAALDEYKYQDTKQMPPWFTTSLEGKEDIEKFLKGNDEVRKFGHYDSDGEFFEVNKVQARAVVIDGSNVAHNTIGDKKNKPTVKNMLRMVRFLKSKQIDEITIIADASLKHRLEDKQDLPELQELVEYLEAPAERPADAFLIDYVKRNHCLLISNDTFREWKVKDSWTAENIDFYRLSFMIKGDEILMPDID